MDLKNPEVKYLATRVYALELVLRGICAVQPELAKAVAPFVDMYEDLTLATPIPDAQREAVQEIARKIIGAAPRT